MVLEKPHALAQQSRDMHRFASILASARNQFESRGCDGRRNRQRSRLQSGDLLCPLPRQGGDLGAISAEATSVMSSCEDLDRTLETLSRYEPEWKSVADSGALDPVEFIADDIDCPADVIACALMEQV